MKFKGRKINHLQKWRRGWDSNPRYGFPYARFRGEYFQPLSHLSAVVADLIVAEQLIFRQSGTHPVGQDGAGGPEHAPNRPARNREGNLLSARGEKRLEHGDGFTGENACGDFDLVVEAWIGKDFEAGADGAALGVIRSVDEAWDTGLNDRAGAHAAGLNGDVERRVREAIVAEEAGGFTKHDDFGVGGRIVVADGAIAGTRENLSVVNQDGSDGHFASEGRGAGFRECFLHEWEVSFHLRREDSMGKEKKWN